MKWGKKPATQPSSSYDWVIVKTTGTNGIRLAYFKWSAHKTWDWTRDVRQAQRFTCPSYAEKAIMSTSAEWQAKWEVAKLST